MLSLTLYRGPSIWMVTGSFFWRSLHGLKPCFHWSAYWCIGNGKEIAFWFDSWGGLPLRSQISTDPTPMPRISLADALPIAQALEPQLSLDTTIVLTEQRDSLYWRWSSKGIYTASSTYNIMMSGGMVAYGSTKRRGEAGHQTQSGYSYT